MTIARQRFCKHRLKAGEPEWTSIAEQRFGKRVSATTDTLVKVKALRWIDARFHGNG
jgi:hypothetical protein